MCARAGDRNGMILTPNGCQAIQKDIIRNAVRDSGIIRNAVSDSSV